MFWEFGIWDKGTCSLSEPVETNACAGCIAVRCSVLQCVAVRCNVLRCVAVCAVGSLCWRAWLNAYVSCIKCVGLFCIAFDVWVGVSKCIHMGHIILNI